jgi:hypothetical protein
MSVHNASVNCFYVSNNEELLESHDRQIKTHPKHSVDIEDEERHCSGDFKTMSDSQIFLPLIVLFTH